MLKALEREAQHFRSVQRGGSFLQKGWRHGGEKLLLGEADFHKKEEEKTSAGLGGRNRGGLNKNKDMITTFQRGRRSGELPRREEGSHIPKQRISHLIFNKGRTKELKFSSHKGKRRLRRNGSRDYPRPKVCHFL